MGKPKKKQPSTGDLHRKPIKSPTAVEEAKRTTPHRVRKGRRAE